MRIEQMDGALGNIIATNEPIRQLANGYGGDIGPAEGPLWMAEGKFLYFNDIQTARRMKYTPGQQGATVAMEKTNEANGLTRDLQGRIVSAEHLTRRVTRYEPDGSVTVIANSFGGKRLLRPNDVVVKSDGAIYFTDPGGPLAPDQWDVTVAGVYRVSADLGTMSLVVDDMVGPNGLAFSPDESILYVNDARRRHARAYDLLPNGTLAKQTSRIFADLGGPEPGVPDGMKVDVPGQRLYRRRRRSLHHGQDRQEARPHRPRSARDDQRGLRRRRLEDALFHHAEHALLGQREDRGRSRAGKEEDGLNGTRGGQRVARSGLMVLSVAALAAFSSPSLAQTPIGSRPGARRSRASAKPRSAMPPPA